jgi:hypothetical protein
MRRITRAALAAAVSTFGLLAACDGCHRGAAHGDAGAPVVAESGKPTLRLYVVSDMAGALEPCGCQKDMLGGVDHLGGLIARERAAGIQDAALLSVGPTFFMDETVKPERLEQDGWKAEAIAASLKSCGLAAVTPGKNDWAGGAPMLGKLRDASGAPLVAANVSGASAAGIVKESIRDLGGVKVAFLGVSVPKSASGAPEGVSIDDASKALSEAAKSARKRGARVVVGLVAMERGDAIRAAEAVPELDVMAIGSPFSDGEANTGPKPPRFVGPVLVVQPSNHLTRVSVIDLFVRGEGRFADGSGLTNADELADLETQIGDLEKRLVGWEKDPQVPKADVDAQKKRLAGMKDRLAKARQPPATPTGSFLRYQLVDVKESIAKEPQASAAMKAYYERVNAFNKDKFKDKKAPPPAKGEAYYVGQENCAPCHAAASEVWKSVGHARAYKTLADGAKEFNLDCVGCHVTGYDKPGGSTVTDLVSPDLKNVQCESCHGPGSKHGADPSSAQLASDPGVSVCLGCHHPPHTDVFDYASRKERILGPGHGKPGAKPYNDPPKGWTPPKPRF